MSEKQLNDLPEEILLQVFEYLDFKTLMESSFVCKKWNEIIGDNSAIMQKIKLAIDGSQKGVQMLPEEFTRSYRSVKIFDWHTGFEIISKMLEYQASNLRNLDIEYCGIKKESMQNFKKFLASLTKLETLRIKDSYHDIDIPHLNRLKTLELESYNISVLKFPEAAQLTSLKIVNLRYFEPSALISFLANQKSLEDLTILHCSFTRNVNLETLQRVPEFPLKKLTMEGYKWLGSEENLLLFMNKFVNSLEELEVGLDFPKSFYEMIFKKCHRLKILRVEFAEFSEESSFHLNLDPNLSLQELTVFGFTSDLKATKEMISKLPNLQTLNLEMLESSNELMIFIANKLKKLRDLQVFYVSDQTFDGVNIPSMKKITFEYFRYIKSQEECKLMNKALPNIEELEVRSFLGRNILNEEFVKTISKGWKQLKRIKLGDDFETHF